jgi:hypothetical protein
MMPGPGSRYSESWQARLGKGGLGLRSEHYLTAPCIYLPIAQYPLQK